MNISSSRRKLNRTASYFIVICVVAVGVLSPACTIPPVQAGEKPNSHAILNVRYSLTRYNIVPEWREGVIEIELYEKRAPITTANFILLAESGFYDGTLFHRVIDDFVIQGGDPNTRDNKNQLDWWNDGNGGSGKKIDFERHDELTHIDGAVGMAREFGDKDSAESQFYICDGAQHRLDDNEENNQNRTYKAIDENGYAVFGITVKGIEIVREIATVWTTTDLEIDTPGPLPTAQAHVHDHPIFDVLVRKVTIVHYREKSNDDGFTVQQMAGLGTVIFVAAGAVLIILLRKGRLKELEKRIPRKLRFK